MSIDLSKVDLEGIIKSYPYNLKDLYGDFGVTVNGFEIWKTIRYLDYDFYSHQAIEEEKYLVISLEKLLFQKALAMKEPKYRKDLELIVKKITDGQSKQLDTIRKENALLISNLESFGFLEKKSK